VTEHFSPRANRVPGGLSGACRTIVVLVLVYSGGPSSRAGCRWRPPIWSEQGLLRVVRTPAQVPAGLPIDGSFGDGSAVSFGAEGPPARVGPATAPVLSVLCRPPRASNGTVPRAGAQGGCRSSAFPLDVRAQGRTVIYSRCCLVFLRWFGVVPALWPPSLWEPFLVCSKGELVLLLLLLQEVDRAVRLIDRLAGWPN